LKWAIFAKKNQMEQLQKHLFGTDQIIALSKQVESLFEQQLNEWPLLKTNVDALQNIERRNIPFKGFGFEVQHNPSRERSTCADTRKEAIEQRPCFLCIENLPNEQKGILLNDRYLLLANPYPIFKHHLTIADTNHTRQNLSGRLADMLNITSKLENYTVFYNGPACGASAPDHFHLQACPFGAMPINIELDSLPQINRKLLYLDNSISVSKTENYLRNVYVFESTIPESIIAHAEKMIRQLPFDDASDEPMFNLMCSYREERYRLLLFPRIAHRPKCYFKAGPEQIVVSVASVELGGIIVTPRRHDYLKLTNNDLATIFNEVCRD
jgi:hypothetical protein